LDYADGETIRDKFDVERASDEVVGDLNVTGQIGVVTEGNDILMISALKYGDVLSITDSNIAIMPADSDYYVKGFRIAGHDDLVSSFTVEKDLDLVVVYGVTGDMVSYTVRYLDESGNALATERTYSGKVGDKPVVAYQYIEGYIPQAYSLTKTLSENTVDNEFDFVYTPRTTTTYNYTTTTVTEPGETVTVEGEAATPAAGEAGAAGGAAAGGAAAGAGAAGGGAAAGADANIADDNVPLGAGGDANIDDEDVPLGAGDDQTPEELVDLDDEDVPLAGGESEATAEQVFTRNMTIIAGVLAAAAVAGIISVVVLSVKRRNNTK
jgi:hypothetical protein